MLEPRAAAAHSDSPSTNRPSSAARDRPRTGRSSRGRTKSPPQITLNATSVRHTASNCRHAHSRSECRIMYNPIAS